MKAFSRLIFVLVFLIPHTSKSQIIYSFDVVGTSNRTGYLTRFDFSSCNLDTVSIFNLSGYDFASDEYRGISGDFSTLFFPLKRLSDNKKGLFGAKLFQPNQFSFLPFTLPTNYSTNLNDFIFNPIDNHIYSFGYDNINEKMHLMKTDLFGNTVSLTSDIPRDFFMFSNYIQTQMAMNFSSGEIYLSSTYEDSLRLIRYNTNTGIIDSLAVWKETDLVSMGVGMFFSANRNSLVSLGFSGDVKGIVEFNLTNNTTTMLYSMANNRYDDAMTYDFINDDYIIRTRDTLIIYNIPSGIETKRCIQNNFNRVEALFLPSQFPNSNSDEQGLESKFSVYPNPGLNLVTINKERLEDIQKLKVINNQGIIIKELETPNSDNFTIDFSEIISGFYKIILISKDGIYEGTWIKL